MNVFFYGSRTFMFNFLCYFVVVKVGAFWVKCLKDGSFVGDNGGVISVIVCSVITMKR